MRNILFSEEKNLFRANESGCSARILFIDSISKILFYVAFTQGIFFSLVQRYLANIRLCIQ